MGVLFSSLLNGAQKEGGKMQIRAIQSKLLPALAILIEKVMKDIFVP